MKTFEKGDVVRRFNVVTGRDDYGIVVDVDLALITFCFRLTGKHMLLRQLHELSAQDFDVITAQSATQQRIVDELRSDVAEYMKTTWSVTL